MTTAETFVQNETLKLENRMFWARIIGSALGYLVITLILNSIRATAPLWVVWTLIVIQFALYFAIFISGYTRSKALGLNKTLAFVAFVILAVLGRVNDWEVVVIPLAVIAMLIWSATKKVPPSKPVS
jgi:hypothetical protein